MEYHLRAIAHNGFVYAEVRNGMYGLPQAGQLAHEKLKPILINAGYKPAKVTPGLWHDTHSDLQFVLIVDDFGIKWTNQRHVHRLSNVIREHYEITLD